MKHTFTLMALGIGALTLAAGAFAHSPSSAKVLIRHQTRGCHTWSVNGNAYKASQSVQLTKGGTITFTNNDVMPHKLAQVAGPKLTLPASAKMSHMMATTKVTFSKAGVYKFTTKPGEDYANMSGMKTIGEDYVMTLKVTVT